MNTVLPREIIDMAEVVDLVVVVEEEEVDDHPQAVVDQVNLIIQETRVVD